MPDITRFIPAEYADTVALWENRDSGVLKTEPLLLKACRAGRFGAHYAYPGGAVDQALFVYLSGTPGEAFFRAHPELFAGTFLVCMSREWEAFLRSLPNEKLLMARSLMEYTGKAALPEPPALPDGFRLAPFDARAYAYRPFDHGANYPSYAAFAADGAGAVVWCGEKIAASASSFFTFDNGVEIDVSTLPEHRSRGLAAACTAALLRQCRQKGLIPHWDAQNPPSRRLAEKFGFTLRQEYAVTMLG